MATTKDEIIDIDLSEVRKKRFRIDGNSNRILELNTSDMGIITRLSSGYKRLDKLAEKATKLQNEIPELSDSEEDMTQLEKLADAISSIDTEMRAIMDEIFDSNVSEICAPQGTMFDFFGGQLRFEYILNKLVKLYGDNIANEFKLAKKKMSKYTNKYTKK